MGNFLFVSFVDIKNPDAGGAEKIVYELGYRLAKDKQKVTLLCSGFSGCKNEEILNGVRIIRCGTKLTFFAHAWVWLIQNNAKKKFDLVLEDMNKVPLFTPFLFGKKAVGLYSHINKWIYFKELFFPVAGIAFAMENWLMPTGYSQNQFLVCSNFTKKELSKLGIREDNITILRNGIDHQTLRPIDFDKKKADQILVLGRLKAYKRIEVAIGAMKGILRKKPNAHLLIAGEGDNRNTLEDLVRKLRLEKSVFFLGHISEEEKSKLLRESALVLHPSLKEGWGINVIEANACGTPAVASDIGGLRESIINKKTGILVTENDTEALANATLKILNNSNIRKHMAKNCINHAKEYSWDKSYSEFLNFINTTLKKNRY